MYKVACQLALVSILALSLANCSRREGGRRSGVERGKYLVAIGSCNDCHTPKLPGSSGEPVLDVSKLLSGHPVNLPAPSWSPDDLKQKNVAVATNAVFTAWAGPWGVSFVINLTPDKETGIGEWSEESFIKLARTGKHQGQPNGRDILPPMPWFSMKDLSDADLKAIWAYLRSLPPIKNQVPLPILPTTATKSAGKS